MSLSDLEGAVYGPYPYRTCSEKVAEYVAATGDDPGRWTRMAPPSIAGAALFVVAPHLLADPAAASEARSVIHGEQSFTWHRPIPVEADLEVTGTVSRVRARGGVSFVGFDLDVRAGSEPVVEGSSTFLMSGDAPPAGGAGEEPEPPPDARGPHDPLPDDAVLGDEPGPLARSASRADLVRYAAASRDWNPIHWDHDAAVAAGLAGVVVHGLLQSAWLCSVAAARVPDDRPLASARFRYRAPMRPGAAASVVGSVRDPETLDLSLVAGDTTFVSGVVSLAVTP